jgi:hypothetical protein
MTRRSSPGCRPRPSAGKQYRPAAGHGDEGLTVKIWTARRPANGKSPRGTPHDPSAHPPRDRSRRPAPASAARPVPRVSFEFFPPKTPRCGGDPVEGDHPPGAAGPGLRVGDLRGRRLDPRAHPPHGARILDETSLKPAAHLTCVDASREEVDEVIRDYWETGVRHIVSCAAIRPRGRRRGLCAARRRLRQRHRTDQGHHAASPRSRCWSASIRRSIRRARRWSTTSTS